MMPSFTYGGFVALQVGGMALFVSLAVTGFIRLGGLGDIPVSRSSHSRPTPTAGGIGIVAGVGAALLIAALFHGDYLFAAQGSSARLASVLSLAFAVSVLGFIDDVVIIPTRRKFLVLLLICAFMAMIIGPINKLPFGGDHIYLLWGSALGGTILWLFVVTNAVNFIDGVNGMMGMSLGVASAALCAVSVKVGAPSTAVLSGALCASLIGFLVYNLSPWARIFAGDCGSLFAGLLYASAVLLLVREQPHMRLLYVGPLLILPTLIDVLMTLIRKPMLGLSIFAAHRSHLYQRLAQLMGRHWPVTLIYGGLSVGLAGLVMFALRQGTLGSMSGLGLMIGLMSSLYLAVSVLIPKQ